MNTRTSPQKVILYHSVRIAAIGLFLFQSSCSLFRHNKFDPRDEASTKGAIDPVFNDSKEKETIKPEWLQAPTKEYTLGPGDKLDIEILSESGSRASTFVTPDSKIYYNLLPGLDVQGKTLSQLKIDMEQKLAALYRHPEVTLTLVEVNSQRVWVLGRLYAPGIFPMRRPMRVMDAITQAGGLFASDFSGTSEELADLAHSFIKRGNKLMPVDFQKLLRDGDMSQNIWLEPNDFIYLPSSLSNEVYVLGAANTQRSVGFMNEMNILGALGKASGTREGADLSHVTIVRGSLTDPKYAVVNVNDIMRGKATNVRLQPGDIIYVPPHGQSAPLSYVTQALNIFTNSLGGTVGPHDFTEEAVVGTSNFIGGSIGSRLVSQPKSSN